MGLEQTVLNRLSSTVTNTLSRKNNNLCYNLDLLNDDVNFSRVGQFLTYLAKVQPSLYLQFSSRTQDAAQGKLNVQSRTHTLKKEDMLFLYTNLQNFLPPFEGSRKAQLHSVMAKAVQGAGDMKRIAAAIYTGRLGAWHCSKHLPHNASFPLPQDAKRDTHHTVLPFLRCRNQGTGRLGRLLHITQAVDDGAGIQNQVPIQVPENPA